MIYAYLALGAVALVLYIGLKVKGCSLTAVFLKTIVSVLFIATAVCAVSMTKPLDAALTAGGLVTMGLVFGLLGDIWLDLKYVFRERDDAFTYAGFTAFAIGHVLYITSMLIRFFPKGKPLHLVLPFVLAVLLSVGNALLEKPTKLHFGKMKPIAFAYGILLFSTLFLSLSLCIFWGWQERALVFMFIGAVLFTASDLVLSGTYFGVGRDRPVDIILNYVTYYPAQFLIALSLLFLK